MAPDDGGAPRRIEVLAYDPNWVDRFREGAADLRRLLGDQVLAVHRIGSTCVPGLDAKPIIDLLVEVRDIAAIDGYGATMRAAGYLVLAENGLARRRFFVRGSETERSLHVHVYAAGDVSCRRHLAVRDFLRAHPDACAAYAALKRRLAERFPTDAGGYVAGKAHFVLEMQSRALAWAAQRDAENSEGREQPLDHPFKHGDRILFQGDSVTDCGRDRDDPTALGYGYVMLTAAALQARAPELDLTILNRGIGGNRSRDLVARWSEDCVDLAPDWVSIMIGINDTWRRYDSNDPTTAEQFESAYRTLLQRVTAETSARIVLCEPFLLDYPADRLA